MITAEFSLHYDYAFTRLRDADTLFRLISLRR
jgi:hypothetical protein